MIDQKIISVVTVVFNGASQIEKTIQSIINQKYKKIQYIIIDGGSTDKTIEIIEKYKDKIDVFISESDNGIYDAMNKALPFCKGDWINYMNVGDTFFSNNTLESLFRNNIFKSDIIYGNHQVIYPKLLINKYPNALKNIWKGMPMQHQSIFIHRSVFDNKTFNTYYKYAADYDLIYYCFNSCYKFQYVNEIISQVSANGFSESNSISTYLEFKNISLKYDKNISHKIYFYLLIPYRKFVLFVKKRLKLNNLLFKLRY